MLATQTVLMFADAATGWDNSDSDVTCRADMFRDDALMLQFRPTSCCSLPVPSPISLCFLSVNPDTQISRMLCLHHARN